MILRSAPGFEASIVLWANGQRVSKISLALEQPRLSLQKTHGF